MQRTLSRDSLSRLLIPSSSSGSSFFNMSSPSHPSSLLATPNLSSDANETAQPAEVAADLSEDADDKAGLESGDKNQDVDTLITELRASLASSQTLLSSQATRLSTLADLEVSHQQLKDQYAFLAAAKEAVEKQLREEVMRREAAEEQTEALRGQVEMARRGVMTLQKQEKERKRMSMMGAPAGLGLSTGLLEGEENLLEGADKGKDRSSTSLAVAKPSRRISTNSEPEHLTAPAPPGSALSTSPHLGSGSLAQPPAGRAGGLRELRLGGASAVAPTVTSPSTMTFEDPYTQPSRTSISPPPVSASPSKAMTAAKAETEKLRTELAAAQLRLAESEEARQASETVLKALREFISAGAGSGGGVVDLNDPDTMEELRGISLPPLPTDKEPDEPQERTRVTSGAGGWGFKLWQSKASGPLSPSSQAVEPPFTPHQGLSPPPSIRSNSTPKVSPMVGTNDLPLQEGAVANVPAQTPLGSFVSNWTKSVAPGTPAPAAAGSTSGSGATLQPSATRAFSAFFGRKTGAQKTDKDLPAKPDLAKESSEDNASEVGSLGAERTHEEVLEPAPSGAKIELQPSPEIREVENDPAQISPKPDQGDEGAGEEETPK